MKLAEALPHTHQRIQVRDTILACDACKLGAGSRRVPFDGPTSQPDLLIMGEAPGANEDREGRPFVGRAGILLGKLLTKAGTARDKVTVINSVCCRPPRNRDPAQDEIEACRPNFMAQLELSKAWVGVAMGRVALAVVKDQPGIAIGINRSKPFWAYGKLWIPTYHTAYALRNPSAVGQIVDDLTRAVGIVRGRHDFPVNREWPDMEIIEGRLILRDESVRVSPVLASHYPVYTRVEWLRIQAGFGKMLDAIDLVKESLGATAID